MSAPRYTYPLMLDVADRLCVIVGGGSVAARKASGLIRGGATRLRVVAPSWGDDFPFAPEVELIRDAYAPHHLDGAGLVFAATDDPAVNAAVVRDAHARNLLVARADASAEDDAGDFATPATHRDGDLVLTVSAAGFPGLAVRILVATLEHLDGRWATIVAALRDMRARVLAGGLAPGPRRTALRDLVSDDALAVLGRASDPEQLWSWLKERHPGL